MNKKHVALIVVMILLSIVLIIGGTYAFFQAGIDNTNNEEMQITSGEMILTFTDNNAINLTDAKPGSIETKTFTVESKGNLETKYNLKFTNINNTFLNNEIYYTLTGDNGIDTKGYISSEYASEGDFYIAKDIPIGKSTDSNKLHTYTLTLEFISKNKPQNYNQEATFTSLINADNNREAEIHVESLSKYCNEQSLSECMIEQYDKFGKELIDDDPDANIRYMGANPNNYIWFNCDDYSNPTEETCERWRIIGSFKNIEKVNEDDTITPQNLVKIIRNESIGYMVWDNKPKGVGSSVIEYGSNNWSDARLMMLLNPGYEDNELMGEGLKGSLYWNREDGECIANTSATFSTREEIVGLLDGSSMECNLGSKGLKEKTRTMVEYVEWDIGAGAVEGPDNTGTAEQFYEATREETIPTGYPAKWRGYVGLMYPSDYGYATAGGDGEIDRDACLTTPLTSYNYSCQHKNWLYSTKEVEATLLSYIINTNYTYNLYFLMPEGYIRGIGGYWYGSGTFEARVTRPVLYLTHETKITNGDGTYDNPYVIGVN